MVIVDGKEVLISESFVMLPGERAVVSVPSVYEGGISFRCAQEQRQESASAAHGFGVSVPLLPAGQSFLLDWPDLITVREGEITGRIVGHRVDAGMMVYVNLYIVRPSKKTT